MDTNTHHYISCFLPLHHSKETSTDGVKCFFPRWRWHVVIRNNPTVIDQSEFKQWRSRCTAHTRPIPTLKTLMHRTPSKINTWSRLAGQVLGSLPAGLYFPVSTLLRASPAACVKASKYTGITWYKLFCSLQDHTTTSIMAVRHSSELQSNVGRQDYHKYETFGGRFLFGEMVWVPKGIIP